MTDPTAFAKLVPGFDFLQGLVKNAGAALPNMGHWVAPTLDPEELDKRIKELRTVQFWLEQNARMLGATIQALEVQRMTLATLKGMNVSFGDLTESLKIRMPEPAPQPAGDDEPAASPAPKPSAARRRSGKAAAPKAPVVPPGVPDPMQWWGALTQQFTELAANAMKDNSAEAARHMAGAMVKQGIDVAGQTLKSAATMPMTVAKGAASAAEGVVRRATGADRAAAPKAEPARRKAAARRR